MQCTTVMIGVGRTHQRGQLRRATSVSDVKSTASWTGGAGLSELIHGLYLLLRERISWQQSDDADGRRLIEDVE